jgi:predicted phosphodiesterase
MSDYDLVVTDIHTAHDDDFKRHRALGNMILEEKPRSLIFVGDFASLDSCSSYDKVKRCSMAEDVEAIKHAYRLIFGPLLEWSSRQRSHRHRGHDMRTVWCEGNHEEREKRIRKEDPDGYASLIDFQSIICPPHYWDEWYDYGHVVNVNGINYTHIPIGKTGRPMGYTTVARQTNGHLIYGHTHEMRMTPVPQVDSVNSVRMILNAPAFLPQDQKEHYCERSTTGWVYGLLRVRPQGPTRPFTFDFLSTEEVVNKYT